MLCTLGGFQRALADGFNATFGKKDLEQRKPSVSEEWVVDGDGVEVENVALKLTDITRLSGFVDS